MRHYKAKVCVIGDPAVGKTSLVSRYVLGEWDGRRRSTIGAKVSQRGQLLDLRNFGLTLSKLSDGTVLEWPPQVQLDMIIWDVMGSKGIKEVVREAYFDGARGLLAVSDLTRRPTLETLPAWIEAARGAAGGVPVVFAVNKSDLEGERAFGEDEARAVAAAYDADLFYTSAKADANVGMAFQHLAGDIVLALLGF